MPSLSKQEAAIVPRSPVVAFVWSLVMPGVGHLYLGQLGTALALFVACHTLQLGLLPQLITLGFNGLIGAIILTLVGWVAIASLAAVTARRLGEVAWKWYMGAWACLAAVVALAVLNSQVIAPLTQSGFRAVGSYYIPSEAMRPTLVVRDYIMVDERRRGTPQRGDIVIFKPPEAAHADHKSYIKRVVALPGERLELRGRQLLINGQPIAEPYAWYEESPGDNPDISVVVPQGHVYVLGDNRYNSQDSRYWGPLPIENIKGRALYIFYSPDRARIGLNLRP